MAQKSFTKGHDFAQLIQQAEMSRQIIGHKVVAVRKKLDFPGRVRHSLSEKPSAWLAGSVASGWVASLLFRKKPKKVEKPVKRGLVITLIGLGLSALQPLAKIWLTNQVKNYLSKQRLSFNPRAPR